jgi:hypothetical protein
MELISAAGQYLVSVCLMPHVPYKSIVWRVEHIVHRNSQLNGAKAGTGMAADTRTRIDDELADLVGNLLEVLNPQLPQIGR